MALDGLLISRAQSAFTIGYHILWPAYSIGISGFLVILNVLWLWSQRPVYRALLRFWIHLFALGFAMGVATGPPSLALGLGLQRRRRACRILSGAGAGRLHRRDQAPRRRIRGRHVRF